MKNFFILLLLISSCTIAPHVTVTNVGNGNNMNNPIADGKIYATAYQQRAAEYRALCYQAYNIARLRIDEDLKKHSDKPKAVITDIDETLLNNSAFEAHQVLQGKDYESAAWYDWSSRIAADTVPGSLDFFRYAASKGIVVFYVTNRSERERAFTLKNLQKFNFPDADSVHLFLMQNTSSKESRRQAIEANYTVVMLLGDNLGDFSSFFDKKTVEQRNDNVNALKSEFGNKFIALPNPVYGDWESSLYQYNYSLAPAQKDSVIKASLYSY